MGGGVLLRAIASGVVFAFLSFGLPSRGATVSAAVSPDLVPAYRDGDAGVSIVPPRGWLLAPGGSLDRQGDEQAYEVARFQLRLGDPALYAQPLPVTGGLLADAGAVLSISLARDGSDLSSVDLSAFTPDALTRLPGATAVDSETSYDGVTTFTRILVARDTRRIVVVRAYVPAGDRDAFAPRILAAIASTTLDPDGPSGPAYVAPAPPAPAPAPAPEVAVASVSAPDPSAVARADIIARASLLLGTPYVWGGDAAGVGMDCSAYVSAAWNVSRYTTDSIWNVAVPVAKAGLLPGDAMDLETWRDPDGYGHIRLFDAWANAAHTLVWVYEETPSRAIHRVIAYDDAYTPMRLAGLTGDGTAPLVPAPAAQPVRLVRHAATP
ncbi:MAG: C40 family peptidase, partial [Chloroflexota bacterium]|nr:C40 family peptidase [Chloroflexota bacterium]